VLLFRRPALQSDFGAARHYYAEEDQCRPPAADLADRAQRVSTPVPAVVAAGLGPLPPRPGCSAPSAERDVVACGPWPEAVVIGVVVVGTSSPPVPAMPTVAPVVAAAVIGVSGGIPGAWVSPRPLQCALVAAFPLCRP
jgi:hypothetical protein